MFNNRWLTGSLLLGLVIAVSLVSSIPIYTAGVMQKLLIGELEEHQIETEEFPGVFNFSDSFSPPVEDPGDTFLKVEQIQKDVTHDIDLPILDENVMMGTVNMNVDFHDEDRREHENRPRDGKLVMLTGIEDHITLVDGRFPKEEKVDGVVEVLVSEEALHRRSMVLNTPFIIHNEKEEFEYIIKPVGAFERKNPESPYWALIPHNLSQDFIVHEEWFRQTIIEEHEHVLWIGRFSTAFDYYEITPDHIPDLLRLAGRIKNRVERVKEADILFNFPIHSIIRSYEEKSKQMTTMLWSLNVPVLIMLAIYLFMISRLIVNRQLNEIAVFSSRGASRLQIWLIYLIEVCLLGLIAFIIGPLIGLQFSKILGATNGFLEFIQRSALPVELSIKSYIYGLFTVLASIVMVMAPVLQTAGQSIVGRKQEEARSNGRIQWVIIVFEVLILAFAVYELVTFTRRQRELLDFNVESADLMIDPILFFLPALFLIGVGLITLRIYPYILKGIFKIGGKLWSFSIYSTFLQVSRSSKQYRFLMMFLVMTIGMGVFSASAARTINTNLEEQLYYANGAEVRMQVDWPSNLPPAMPPMGMEGDEEEQSSFFEEEEVVYTEPPFDPIENLPSVDSTAKVFMKEDVTVAKGDENIKFAQLMAIETKDFGETAWFKNSLVPKDYHWYQYLNLMANEQSAVLVSEETASLLNLRKGDTITMNWRNSDHGEFIVYEIIEYWPTFNPLERLEEDENQRKALVVANLPYVQMMLGLEPYEVWLNVKPDRTRAEFYEELEEEGIRVTAMNDVVPDVIKLKNSALLLGVNGSMTMGFFISLLISFIGFLLYWILTIQSRTLQYGIYRAMGVSMFRLTGIMIWEQMLTSGMACVLGILIGGLTSYLYVPLFKVSLAIDQLMPPFTVISDAADENKIYIFVAAMLVLGSAILIGFLRKIKISQAIKLGED